MVNFESELPTWQAEGVRPPDNMLKEGWKASQKPPADYFNWFFSRTHSALKELQEKAATEENLDLHKVRTDNPHKVTAAQVGLSNVINQKQATKIEFDAHDTDSVRHITDSERNNWNSKANGKHNHYWGDIQNVPIGSLGQLGVIRLVDSVASTDRTKAATPNSVKDAYDRGTQGIADAAAVQKNLDSHSQSKNNPHAVTASQVGLGKVSNFDIATTEDAVSGTSNSKYVTPFTVNEAIKALQAVKSVNGKFGTVVIGKSDVGLGNVENIQQASKADFDNHVNDSDRHITDRERASWNAKADIASNVASASKLLNARKINDVLFDGTKDITVLASPHEFILNDQPIVYSMGEFTLLDDIKNYEALELVIKLIGNTSSQLLMHKNAQTVNTHFSGVNVYDNPDQKGWQLLEGYVTFQDNKARFNYAKAISYFGEISSNTDDISIVNVIGRKNAPRLFGT